MEVPFAEKTGIVLRCSVTRANPLERTLALHGYDAVRHRPPIALTCICPAACPVAQRGGGQSFVLWWAIGKYDRKYECVNTCACLYVYTCVCIMHVYMYVYAFVLCVCVHLNFAVVCHQAFLQLTQLHLNDVYYARKKRRAAPRLITLAITACSVCSPY